MEAYGFCICCQRSINRIGSSRRRSYVLNNEFIQSHPFLLTYFEVVKVQEFNAEDSVCRPCLQRAERHGQGVLIVQDEQEEPAQENPAPQHHVPMVIENMQDQAVQVNRLQMVRVAGYTRAPYNTRSCIFAECRNRVLQNIRRDIRATILQGKKFYIPRFSRVCEEHSTGMEWHNIELSTRRVLHKFSPTHVSDMMELLRTQKVFLDFERNTLNHNTIFQYYIGFTKSQFNQILQSTPRIARRFRKKPATALATVLAKLHTGESNERLSSIFRMTRKTFEKTMALVRTYLMQEFVPQHLGYNHMTREDVMSHCLSVPNALFGNPEAPLIERKAIVIMNGTYIYLQKSSNYYFQRKSYSLHKFRNLVKPFLIVCSDGHILDIYGLYEATKSDATILSEILNSTTDPFHWFFCKDDVFILYRGFRDCIEEVESCGYTPHMPASKDEGETQLTVAQANASRKVTMCRWVVETINGRLKNQFRQLRHQNFNKAAIHLLDEIKIAGALLNCFGKPLTDHRLVEPILEKNGRCGDRNRLSEFVIENNLNQKRARFQTIDGIVPGMDEFPVVSDDDLIIYALGTYQIQQARSYYGEHAKNGSYLIEVYRDSTDFGAQNIDCTDPWILRGRIQSRHTSRRVYYVYILIERDVRLEGIQAILGHYCSCVIGKRSLGCCSHVMAILWYLGWGRHQPNLNPPALFLDTIIRQDEENQRYDEPEDV